MRDVLFRLSPGSTFTTVSTPSYSRLSGLGRRLTHCRAQIGRLNRQQSALLVIVLSCCLPHALFGAATPAALISPAPGSALPGSSATFSWTAGSGVTAYAFHLGTTGVGSSDLFDSGGTLVTSVVVSGLPTNGGTIYATVYSDINGIWAASSYTYTAKKSTAAASAATTAAFISPAPGSTLPGSSVTFSWTPVAGATAYELWLGPSGPGSSSLYNSGNITTNSVTVTGLPTSGTPIYASLYSDVNGAWTAIDATYTEAGSGAISAFSCSSAIMHVVGTYACWITLTTAAPSGGTKVTLTSSSAAITIPAAATIPANAIITVAMADVISVATTQTVTLTASAGGSSRSFAIELSPPGTSTLSTNATSVAFGSVEVGTAATQDITLTSTGTAPVTISGATLTGSSFTTPGAAFPITLNPGQTATLNVQFKPASTGAVTGDLTISSNSSTGSTSVISLSGTGSNTAYQVDLNWEAPPSSAIPVVGYDIYRSVAGSSAYTALNASLDTTTTYLDKTVQAGVTYDYIIESVDGAGVRSAPSNVIAIAVP